MVQCERLSTRVKFLWLELTRTTLPLELIWRCWQVAPFQWCSMFSHHHLRAPVCLLLCQTMSSKELSWPWAMHWAVSALVWLLCLWQTSDLKFWHQLGNPNHATFPAILELYLIWPIKIITILKNYMRIDFLLLLSPFIRITRKEVNSYLKKL